MSATPSQHSPKDFYTPLKLLNAHSLSYADFRVKFCGAYRLSHHIYIDTKPTNKAELLSMLSKVRILAESKRELTLNFKILKLETPDLLKKKPRFEETAEYNYKAGEYKTIRMKDFIRMLGLVKKKSIIFMFHHLNHINLLKKRLKCKAITGETGK